MGRSVSVSASPIKSIQSGWVNTGSLSTGTGEEGRYVDITIAAVNAAKAIICFQGAGSDGLVVNATVYSDGNTTFVTKRLVNSTTLRLMIATTGADFLVGRWSVVEYN